MVNIALLPHFSKENWNVFYVGSKYGIERKIVPDNIPYYPIFTGKLRRYFDWQNFWDIFRVFLGFLQCLFLFGKLRPNIVFSKGGFVSVPVVAAAFVWRVKVIAHEADITPGLANKIAGPFISEYCLAFEKTKSFLPQKKCHVTGIPVRQEVLSGNREKGFQITGFVQGKPVLLIMGGSSGAQAINKAIFSIVDGLLENFQIIHVCGKGQINPNLKKEGYLQFEYVSDELPHFFKITDFAISRAGANALFELLALKIPHLLIPLGLKASRGDQIQNAAEFESKGFSRVMEEEKITPEALLETIKIAFQNKEEQIKAMEMSPALCNPQIVFEIIKEAL